MKCREAEKRIYLYTELTVREREETDKHIDHCPECRRLMELVSAGRRMVSTISHMPPQIPDAASMTRRIMNAVQEKQYKKAFHFNLFPDPSLSLLRYGMAALSLFLIATFFAEYNAGAEFPPPEKQYVTRERKTELNSASFHNALLATAEKEKTTTTFFYECVVNCLYTPNDDCSDCRRKFIKLNQTP